MDHEELSTPLIPSSIVFDFDRPFLAADCTELGSVVGGPDGCE